MMMVFRYFMRRLKHLRLLPAICLLFMDLGSAVNAAAASWTSKAPMPIPTSGGNASVVNGILYVLGGTDSPSNAVQAYDPVSDSWALAPQLPQEMFTGASAVLNEKIYVAGGFAPTIGIHSAVFWYDTITGESQQVGTLVVPRGRFSGTIVDNRFYVVGGSGDTGDLDSIEEIDLATGESVIKQYLPAPTSLAGVAAVDGKVYIFGGYTRGVGALDESWEYDPQTNQLIPLPPMQVASEFETALPYNGKIYLVSSWADYDPNQGNLIQAYDIRNQTWEIVSTVPTPRTVPMAGIINGTFYVAGGVSDGSSNGTVNEALSLGADVTPQVWDLQSDWNNPSPNQSNPVNDSAGRPVWYFYNELTDGTKHLMDSYRTNNIPEPKLEGWEAADAEWCDPYYGTCLPYIGKNFSGHEITVAGLTIPIDAVLFHPGPNQRGVVGWQSPITGRIVIDATFTHLDSSYPDVICSIETASQVLASTSVSYPTPQSYSIPLDVNAGDYVYFTVDKSTDFHGGTTQLEVTITATPGTDPTLIDTDGDGYSDADEIALLSDPLDSSSVPEFATGDLAPHGAPDGVVDVADALLAFRIFSGELTSTPLDMARADISPLGNPDGVINIWDVLLIFRKAAGMISF